MTLDFEGQSAAGEAEGGADPGPAAGGAPGKAAAAGTRRRRIRTAIGRLFDAIRSSDDDAVERAVLQLSRPAAGSPRLP